MLAMMPPPAAAGRTRGSKRQSGKVIRGSMISADFRACTPTMMIGAHHYAKTIGIERYLGIEAACRRWALHAMVASDVQQYAQRGNARS